MDGYKLTELHDIAWLVEKTTAEHRLRLKTDKYCGATTEINLQISPGKAVHHSKPCSKNFTAIKRPPVRAMMNLQRRNLRQHQQGGLLKDTGIFCGKAKKTISQKLEILQSVLHL